MAWLEITVHTQNRDMEAVASALTAAGFSDLVLEDQQEFEEFLDQNRAYWDYIDESLQERLQGLSQIKLYLQQEEQEALSRLRHFVEDQGLSMTQKLMEETDWEESWKDN